jgi:hypothetical protein
MLTILNHTHLDLFLELKKNNPGQWKLGSTYEEIFNPADFYQNILTHKQAYTVGWVEDNQLKSIATLFEDQNSPSWALLYHATVKTLYHKWDEVKSNLVYSELFQESFRRKLTSCSILSRKDNKSVFSQVSDKMKDRLKNKYYKLTPEIEMFEWVDEAVISANTYPKYSYIQWLMGGRSWPFDLILRRGYLKQEHRKDIVCI